jgi:uncharacterized protein with von Willebrand factor type A (vWA) domain
LTADAVGRPALLLAGVDRAVFVVSFGHRLRSAGLPVPLSALGALTRGLAAAPPMDTRELYWLARLTLVHRQPELSVFDEVFDAVFNEAVLPIGPATRHALVQADGDDTMVPVDADDGEEDDGGGLPWHTLPTTTDASDEQPTGPVLPELLPSGVDRFTDIPFDDLDQQQLAQLGAWLEDAARRWPVRRSRRHELHHHGRRIAMRETLARSRRTGWEPFELSRRHPVQRPRPIVMLCDVSQSMQSYSTAYLHLMRAFARTGRAETFAFSTSLTRLTPSLAHRSPQVAMAQATDRVTDRYGGTHLATSVRMLLRSRHGNAIHGGVVVIASDGWDSDEPRELAAAMERVRRRAHRVIWLNPRAASPGFRPLVGSMAAALPYCDDFLPANTVRAMADVIEAITDTGPRPASSRASRARPA